MSRPVTGATRVAGVIGDPVRHSLSPALHNAAFAAAGLDWVYVAFPVAAGRGADAVAAVRALGLAGLSVTMPHKAAVAAAVDRLTPTAAALGVANTVIRAGDDLVGDSTDGPGLIDALRTDLGFDAARSSCVVLGTGGAARAVTHALAASGAASVVVVGRRRDAAEACAALAGPVGRVGVVAEAADANLVINATPVGMTSEGLPLGVDASRFGSGQVVVDLIYVPEVTPLLAAARTAGAATANGLGMLLYQAAHQWRAWTGEEPPIAAMDAALRAALGRPTAL